MNNSPQNTIQRPDLVGTVLYIWTFFCAFLFTQSTLVYGNYEFTVIFFAITSNFFWVTIFFVPFRQIRKLPKPQPLKNYLLIILRNFLFVTIYCITFPLPPLFFLISYSILALATICGFIFRKRKFPTITNDETPFGYPHPISKLFLLNSLLPGWYMWYWWFRNWFYIENRNNTEKRKLFTPIISAFFAIFFSYSFFEILNREAEKYSLNKIRHPNWLATSYLFLITIFTIADSYLLSKVPFSLSGKIIFIILYCYLSGVLATLPLLPAQRLINQINLASNANFIFKENYSKKIIICFLLGIITVGTTISSAFVKSLSPIERGINAAKNHNARIAIALLSKADISHNPEAQLALGRCYLHLAMSNINKKENLPLALQTLQQAANNGSDEAAVLLGSFYLYDEPSYPNAIFWLQKAVKTGNTEALTNLGYMYATGKGVTPNDTLAIQLYEKAAAKGDMVAAENLGEHYQFGKGVTIDYNKAAQYYSQVLTEKDNNYYCAQNNLAILYAQGKGIKQDDHAARKLFKEAADSSASDEKIVNSYLRDINPLHLSKYDAAFADYQMAQLNRNSDDLTKKYTANELDFAKKLAAYLQKDCQ